jgi:hypothetical protein
MLTFIFRISAQPTIIFNIPKEIKGDYKKDTHSLTGSQHLIIGKIVLKYEFYI